MAKIRFYHKKTCSTCRRAKGYLDQLGVELEVIDLAVGLTEADLNTLIGNRDYKQFLNTRNELYRERKMGKNPPTRDEAIALMAANPNLIKRPLIIKGTKYVHGFDEAAVKELLG